MFTFLLISLSVQVTARDAEEWCETAECGHHVASAKDNTGVDEVFAELARRAASYVSAKAEAEGGVRGGRRDPTVRNIDAYDASRDGGCSC
jgi:hypothetical protein